MRTMLTVAVVIVTLFLGLVAAEALDSCFEVGSASNTLVGKAFALPSKGACKAFYGFFKTGDSTLFHTGDFIQGAACGSSNNEWINFQLSGQGYAIHAKLRRSNFLEGSSQPCYYNFVGFGAGACLGPYGFTKVVCSPSTAPVPE